MLVYRENRLCFYVRGCPDLISDHEGLIHKAGMKMETRISITIYIITLIFSVLGIGLSSAMAMTQTIDQPAILFHQIDSESLIITPSSSESCHLSLSLTVPEEDRMKQAFQFTLAMHSDWVVVMNEIGWQPYGGEIPLFNQIALQKKMEPFQLDCTPFSGNPDNRIDFYYGYAIQTPLFFGNAAHLHLYDGMPSTETDLTISKPAIPLESIDVDSLPITLFPMNAENISASLSVPTEAVGSTADLFAAALIDHHILIKTSDGWRLFEDEGPGIEPFGFATLASEQSHFEISLESLQEVVSAKSTPSDIDNIFFYYAYVSKMHPSFMGNIINLQRTDPDCQTQDLFTWAQQAHPIANLQLIQFPNMTLSDQCHTVSPSLTVDPAHVGKEAQLFALLISGDQMIVKGASGWEHYNKEVLKPFSTVTLQSQISGFDLGNLWEEGMESDVGQKPDEVTSATAFNWYNDLTFYFAYTIEDEILKGNGFSLQPQ